VAVRLPHQRDLGGPVGNHVQREGLVIAFPQQGEVVDDLRQRRVVGKRPVVHVNRNQFVALTQEVVHRHRRIDAAAHQHHAPRHRLGEPRSRI